jgi:hypothetical protein
MPDVVTEGSAACAGTEKTLVANSNKPITSNLSDFMKITITTK